MTDETKQDEIQEELAAIGMCVRALSPLAGEALKRVLDYVNARHYPKAGMAAVGFKGLQQSLHSLDGLMP
jgi:hypothetical protein